jgi:L-gulonate 5-dehydrogenase
LNYPIINGHEFCGIVEETGDAVTAFQKGDYVTAEPIIPCNHCYACGIHKPNCCSNLKVLGVHVNGCFAEFIAVKCDRVVRLPAEIPPIKAFIVEPYGIALHALNRLRLEPQENLLILGAGPIGMAALDIARSMGSRVMISDVYEKRLALAGRLDPDMTVNPTREDIGRCVHAFTGGNGFAAILEATGVPAVMQSTQEYVANGGRICIAGVTNHPVQFTGMLFCNKEATIVGTRNSCNEFPQIIRMFAQGTLHPEVLCTHQYTLDQYPEAILKAAKSREDVCKVAILAAADA